MESVAAAPLRCVENKMGAGEIAWLNRPDSATPSPHMSEPTPEHDDFIHSEEFLHGLMRRQLRLSIACAAAFLIVLIGLPLANYFAPDFMGQRVGGFTLTWLVLGVLFFPFVWIIARIFITRSMALEEAEVQHAATGNQKRKA